MRDVIYLGPTIRARLELIYINAGGCIWAPPDGYQRTFHIGTSSWVLRCRGTSRLFVKASRVEG